MRATGTAICALCQGTVDVSIPGTRRLRKGWFDESRAKGEHGLELAENLNEWAHGQCVEMAKMGLSPAQESLRLV